MAPAEKASLLDSQFDSKCREQFITPLSCFDRFNIDTNGGIDTLGAFLLFLKMVVDIIAPKLSIHFRGLIRWGSFSECCRSANATAIPKSAPSPDRKNYRPISITPILCKLCEKLVYHKLSIFLQKICFFACCPVCL